MENEVEVKAFEVQPVECEVDVRVSSFEVEVKTPEMQRAECEGGDEGT